MLNLVLVVLMLHLVLEVLMLNLVLVVLMLNLVVVAESGVSGADAVYGGSVVLSLGVAPYLPLL